MQHGGRLAAGAGTGSGTGSRTAGFGGIVVNVNAKYTMFSPSGNPIRSVVSLSIMQVTEKTGGNYWDKQFDKYFGKPGVDNAVNAKQKAQYIQSLFNVRF